MNRKRHHQKGKRGPNARPYTHTCEWCGGKFTSARPEAKTCSNAHRLKWARWCKKVREQEEGAPVVGPRGDYRKQFFIPAARVRG